MEEKVALEVQKKQVVEETYREVKEEEEGSGE